MRKWPFRLILAAVAAASVTGQAQAAGCSVTGAAASQAVSYDPFNPAPLIARDLAMTITLTGVADTAGGATVNLYLQGQDASANGMSIVARSVSGNVQAEGEGQNIFFDRGAIQPSLLPAGNQPGSGNRFLKLTFGASGPAGATARVAFDVTLPANLDLTASSLLSFDIHFACQTGKSASNAGAQTGVILAGMQMPVRVLSALKTYYAGAPLDFGEVGTIDSASLAASPRQTRAGNAVFVQSTGAYAISLSSANGFRLRNGGTSPDDAIRYRATFLGMTADSASNPGADTPAITRSCRRTGLATTDRMPLQAALEEGGAGKNPSPNFRDILTITVTPLIDSNPGVDSCGGY